MILALANTLRKVKRLLASPLPSDSYTLTINELPRPSDLEARSFTHDYIKSAVPQESLTILDSYRHPRDKAITCVKFKLDNTIHVMFCFKVLTGFRNDYFVSGEW